MNNTQLVSHLKSLVVDERKITSEILTYLREIEARKIFATMGHPSLFEFCTKELGYSEGAAQRRISAMRLIKELPAVQEKIVSGALSLSVISQAQSFFKKKKDLQRPMAVAEKLELLKNLENTSARACEKTLLQLEPLMATKDRERLIAPDTLEIKITVNKDFMQNLEFLKDRLSHKMPSATTKDILEYALSELVKKSNHLMKGSRRELTKSEEQQSVTPQSIQQPSLKQQNVNAQHKNQPNLLAQKLSRTKLPPTSAVTPAMSHITQPMSHTTPPTPHITPPTPQAKNLKVKNLNSRYISAHAKRVTWHKSEGRCAYTDPISKRQCESKRFLEIDHIWPKAHGGHNHHENLQLLCDTHNRLKGANWPSK